MELRYWLIVWALGLGWGASFYFNEVLLQEVGPLTVSMLRVGIAALGVWAFVFATGRFTRLPMTTLMQLFVMGMASFAAPFALYPLSQQFVPSGAVGIINALTPIAVVIVSHFWPGGERATWLKSAGVAAGFVGILFLTIPVLGPGKEDALFGTVMALLAPLCYAFSLNWVRRFKGLDQILMLVWSLTFATLGLVPLALIFEGVPRMVRPESYAAALVIGLLLTGIAFIVFYWLLPRIGATNISTVTFIAPVSAVLIGTLALSETLEIAHFLGMGAIFLGLLLLDGRIVRRFRRCV